MSVSLMLSQIQEHGSRQQCEHAAIYAARGDRDAVQAIYARVVRY